MLQKGSSVARAAKNLRTNASEGAAGNAEPKRAVTELGEHLLTLSSDVMRERIGAMPMQVDPVQYLYLGPEEDVSDGPAARNLRNECLRCYGPREW